MALDLLNSDYYSQYIQPRTRGRLVSSYLDRGMSADDPSAQGIVAGGMNDLEMERQDAVNERLKQLRNQRAGIMQQQRTQEQTRQQGITAGLANQFGTSTAGRQIIGGAASSMYGDSEPLTSDVMAPLASLGNSTVSGQNNGVLGSIGERDFGTGSMASSKGYSGYATRRNPNYNTKVNSSYGQVPTQKISATDELKMKVKSAMDELKQKANLQQEVDYNQKLLDWQNSGIGMRGQMPNRPQTIY